MAHSIRALGLQYKGNAISTWIARTTVTVVGSIAVIVAEVHTNFENERIDDCEWDSRPDDAALLFDVIGELEASTWSVTNGAVDKAVEVRLL